VTCFSSHSFHIPEFPGQSNSEKNYHELFNQSVLPASGGVLLKTGHAWWCWWGAGQLTEMRKVNIHALGEISILRFGILWA